MGVQFAGNILVQSNGGPLPISQGGTGQTNATAAINALLPVQAGAAGKVLSTDGTNISWISSGGGSGSPGGSDTNIQFNDSGSFGGSSNFVINKSTGALTSVSTLTNIGLIMNNATSTTRQVAIQTATSNRWLMGSDNATETGTGNAGSNFFLTRVADNGTTTNSVLTVSRSTGIVDFHSTPTVAGLSIAWISPTPLTVPNTAIQSVTFSHSYGRTPTMFSVLIRCKTAEFGYAVGTEIDIKSDCNSGASGLSVYATATTVGYAQQLTGANTIAIRPPAGGLQFITQANWELIARAIFL